MKVSVSAPARSKARAVSYSQLVPAKTGSSTRGFAVLTAGEGHETAFSPVKTGTAVLGVGRR